jgi:hypothetical protein
MLCTKKIYPFDRFTARGCLKWYKLRKNATKDEKNAVSAGDSRCSACNKVYRDVRQRNKSQLPKLTQEARQQRTEAGSCYPMSLLSPRGVKKKMQNINLEKKKRRKKIADLSKCLHKYTEVTLHEEQSHELSAFVENVTEEQLNNALLAEKTATAKALKEAFLHDQQRNSKFVFLLIVYCLEIMASGKRKKVPGKKVLRDQDTRYKIQDNFITHCTCTDIHHISFNIIKFCY